MKKNFRIISIVIAFLTVFSFSLNAFAENEAIQVNSDAEAEGEVLFAKSPYVILMDMKSGITLYSKAADETVYPAGLTTIMSAVLVLEKCNIEEVAKASETALSNVMLGDSKMGISTGDELSVRQLLYGMLLESAADASNVLAEKTFGSIEEFVKQMNSRAGELGMKNTNFTNPTGSHDERQFTTASDMAILLRHAMSIPEFCEIVKTDSYSVAFNDKNKSPKKLFNRNHLVSRLVRNDYYYRYATGAKSAYSTESKSCVAATAQKGSMSVLAVVCGAETKDNVVQSYDDCRRMFDFVFENYESQLIVKKDRLIAQIGVENTRRDNKIILKAEDSLYVIRQKGTEPLNATYKDVLPKKLSAPIKKNQKIGTRKYFVNGECIGEINLLSEKEYRLDPITYIMNRMIDFVTSVWLYVSLILLIAFFILKERRRRRIIRKKRRDARKKRNKELISSIERK